MKLKLLALVVTSLISVNTLAASIDYRHEMMDTPKADHKDRLVISNRLPMVLVYRWKANGSNLAKIPRQTDRIASRSVTVPKWLASYVHNFDKTWSLEPGFSMETSSDSNNYRPYLRGKVNITQDLSYSLRYRPYFKRNSGNIGSTRNTSDSRYNITGLLAYSFLKNW